MPAPAEPDTYEAFLVETHNDTEAWVVAIVRRPTRTEAQRFVRVPDLGQAARLADALNSRILGRRNHPARLRAALTGLPLDVHAAVRNVPTGDTHGPDAPLAEDLCGDPVDGLLLFPSAPGPLTPWAAYLLAVAAELVGDLCHHVAQSAHLHAIRFLLPQLPPQLRRQRPECLLRVAADLDLLAGALRDGLPPDIRTPQARLALELALDHAERLAQNRADLEADVHSVLPTGPVAFTGLRHALLPVAEPQPVARISLRTT